MEKTQVVLQVVMDDCWEENVTHAGKHPDRCDKSRHSGAVRLAAARGHKGGVCGWSAAGVWRVCTERRGGPGQVPAAFVRRLRAVRVTGS